VSNFLDRQLMDSNFHAVVSTREISFFVSYDPPFRRNISGKKTKDRQTDRQTDAWLPYIVSLSFVSQSSTQTVYLSTARKFRLRIIKRLLRQDGVQPHFSRNFKAFLYVTSLTVGLVVEDIQTGQQVHLTWYPQHMDFHPCGSLLQLIISEEQHIEVN
jgi:hypothetical protein